MKTGGSPRAKASKRLAAGNRKSDPIGQVADWLMDRALGETGFEELIGGACERLLAAGVPLWRSHITFRVLHPLYGGMGLTWRRDEGVETDRYVHRGDFPEEFKANPMYHMIQTQVPFLRRRLAGPDALLDFPVLKEFRAAGATDYLAFLIRFGSGYMEGVVGSWATDRRGGFSEAHIQALMSSYAMNVAPPTRASVFVIAAVSVVLPWST